MKIIDKNYDYYDYLQTPDDNIVFDRRNSFNLTKERVIDRIDVIRWDKNSKYRFILMQCGAVYWLFLLTITETTETPYQGKRISDYSLELLTTWKNYNKPRKIIDINFISFHNSHIFYDHNLKDFSIDKIKSRVNDLKNSIDTNDYNEERSLSISYISVKEWKDTKKDIPCTALIQKLLLEERIRSSLCNKNYLKGLKCLYMLTVLSVGNYNYLYLQRLTEIMSIRFL